jgi:hypothetical protein
VTLSVPRALGFLTALLGALLATAEPPAPKSSPFTTIVSSIPTEEVGIPEDVRTDGKEFLVVPVRARRAFWIIDAESGERRKVTVQPPAAITELSVRCVDRLDKKRLVASASWIEENVSRSGLLILDDEGVVESYTGYGFSVRSIVVGPTREWIAGSIQEPVDPRSDDLHRPTSKAMAQFTPSGKLLGMQSMNIEGIVSTFDEMLRTHRLRRVFVVRDSVLLTYPFRTSRVPFPSAYILPGWALETEALRKSGIPRDYSRSWASMHTPKGESFEKAGLKPVGIVPIVSEGRSGLLVAWIAAGPEQENRDTPYRDRGGLFLARYDIEGGRPKSWDEIEDGTRVGELTSSPDGRAFAVTFRDMSKEWSISRIDF